MRNVTKVQRLLWLVLLLLAGCAGTPAAPTEPQLSGDAIRIEEASARPSLVPNGNSALYLKIINPTDQPDRLVQVTTSATQQAEPHESMETNGVMRMEPSHEGYEVPAKSVVALEPGGKHIMLLNIAEPLKVGDQISVTFYFATAQPIVLDVPVQEFTR